MQKKENNKEDMMLLSKKGLTAIAEEHGIVVDDKWTKSMISDAILAYERKNEKTEDETVKGNKNEGVKMPRKQKKEQRSRASKTQTGKREENDNVYKDLFETWDNFSNEMGTEMANIIKESQTNYSVFTNQWMRFYEDTMAKSVQTEPVADVQKVTNVWNNYSDKLMNRMENLVTGSNKSFTSMENTWNEYVSKIGKELLKAANGDGDAMEPNELHRMWVEFSAQEMQDLFKSMNPTTADAQEILGIWHELNTNMQEVMNGTVKSNQAVYEELNKRWTESSAQMNKELTTFVDGYINGFARLQDTWSGSASNMGEHFMGMMKADGFNIERMYADYFERTNEFFRMFNHPFFGMGRGSDDEFKEIKRKVEEMERKLEEIESNEQVLSNNGGI